MDFKLLFFLLIPLALLGCGGGGSAENSNVNKPSGIVEAASVPLVVANAFPITDPICSNDIKIYDCLRYPANDDSSSSVTALVYGLDERVFFDSIGVIWTTSIYIDSKLNSYSENGDLKRNVDSVSWVPQKDGDLITYVYVSGLGVMSIQIDFVDVPDGVELEVDVGGELIKIRPVASRYNYVGEFNVTKVGYNKIRLRAPSFSKEVKLRAFEIGGPATLEVNAKSKDSGVVFSTGYSLAGVSPYLRHNVMVANRNDVKSMYAEMDIVSSFVSGGLFVPVATDDVFVGVYKKSEGVYTAFMSVTLPDGAQSMPTLIAKNEGVSSGDLNGESAGLGVQFDFLVQQPIGFKFLINIEDRVSGFKDYAGYLMIPGANEWMYLATLRRVNDSLNPFSMHSFLDTLNDKTNSIETAANFYNVKVKNATGAWLSSESATLGADKVGIYLDRIDYYGEGVTNGYKLSANGFGEKVTLAGKTISTLGAKSTTAPSVDVPMFRKNVECPIWSSSKSYNFGAMVQYDNKCWSAIAWSRGMAPARNSLHWQ